MKNHDSDFFHRPALHHSGQRFRNVVSAQEAEVNASGNHLLLFFLSDLRALCVSKFPSRDEARNGTACKIDSAIEQDALRGR